MNTFTRSFMDQPFIVDVDIAKLKDCDDPVANEVPAVEVPRLDIARLCMLETRARSNPDLFLAPIHANKNTDWWCRSSSSGWTSITIQPYRTRSTTYHDASATTYDNNPICTRDPILIDLALDIFHAVGLSVKQLHILKLSPGGWLQPHIDTFTDPVGLDYFWIPLHEFPACLKVWPWGWLNHKFGNMYLFNYSKWVHAAHNYSDRDRLILNGRLDLECLPDWFQPTFVQQKKTWQKLWKNER